MTQGVYRATPHSVAIRRRRLSEEEVDEAVTEFTEVQHTIFMAALENDMTLLEDVLGSRDDIAHVRDILARSGMMARNQMIPHFLMRYEQQMNEHALLIRRLLAEQEREEADDNRAKDEATIAYIEELREVIRKDANCSDEDPTIFHPVHLDQLPLARRVCASCIVRWECLFVGVYGDQYEETAVFGGVSPRVRKLLIKSDQAAHTPEQLRERLAQIDEGSMTLDYAAWEYDEARKSYDNNVRGVNPKHATLRKTERVARAALDKFRGQTVSVEVIEAFLDGRDSIRTRKSDIPTIDKIATIPEFLRPGSVRRLATGELQFAADGAYLEG